MRKATKSIRKQDVKRHWVVLDAEGKILGRLATRISDMLRGKHRPTYTPHEDTGDFVVVVNAEKIKVTGDKLKDKVYYRHTRYPGGIKETTLAEQLVKKPEQVLRLAVRGMLPKSRLGKQLIKKLKIYVGAEHPHQAQQPESMA